MNFVSIHILSWNRPHLLWLTLHSLRRALYPVDPSKLKIEVILLDQGSDLATKKIYQQFLANGFINKLIELEKNVGIASGWNIMFENSNEDASYILPLENDWWCGREISWLYSAIEIFEREPKCAFVKLRRLKDRQHGNGLVNKEPWTVQPFPVDIVERKQVLSGEEYFYVKSSHNCFSFNPILMRREFREEFARFYKDDARKGDLLRSSENIITEAWEKQSQWGSASLVNGPFHHIGFNSRRHRYPLLPWYTIKEMLYG